MQCQKKQATLANKQATHTQKRLVEQVNSPKTQNSVYSHIPLFVRQQAKIVPLLETEPGLADVAINVEDFVQFGFLNPTFYFVETYFRKG